MASGHRKDYWGPKSIFMTMADDSEVTDWLVRNHQKVMLVKGDYLHQTHGVPNLDAQFPGPYSYKEYCWLVLNCQFWGGGCCHPECGVLYVGPEDYCD